MLYNQFLTIRLAGPMDTSSDIAQKLEQHGIKPTRQRLLIGACLFDCDQHVTADEVMLRVNQSKKLVSKATVYNTLGLFASHGLLKEVVIDTSKLVYDTNVSAHHHLYHIDRGELEDINLDQVVTQIPDLQSDLEVDGVDVIIRVRQKS